MELRNYNNQKQLVLLSFKSIPSNKGKENKLDSKDASEAFCTACKNLPLKMAKGNNNFAIRLL